MDSEHLTETVVRSIMCVAGMIGNNWLLFSSLPKSSSQLRTSDVLFINLAVSNLITNFLVDTLDIYENVVDVPWGYLYCGFRLFLPELSETSSILTTTFITVYWQQKLVGSLKRGGAPILMDNLNFIFKLLAASWTFSFFFHFPHFFFVAKLGVNQTDAECADELPTQRAENGYEGLYVTLVNVIPLSTILYACIQIVITLLQNEKRMKKMDEEGKSEGNTSAEKSGDNNVSTVTKSNSQAKTGGMVRAAKSVVAVAIVFLICWTIHINVRLFDAIAPTDTTQVMESFIGAIFTCTIPYVYLYGMQKLTCSCC